ITVPATAAQTTLSADLLPGELTLSAAPAPGCPAGTSLCAFAPGMTVLLFDETGNVDALSIAAVDDPASQLTFTTRPADSAATTYKRGTTVVQAKLDVYYRRDEALSGISQLMHYDGSTNTAP